MHLIEPVKNFYGRYESRISSVFLLLGFVFDIITLKRVDTLWENLWITGLIIIAAFFIALIHILESRRGEEALSSRAHFWFVNILQFFFGGILSAYLVLYFRSADIFSTWPFILVLVTAFVANESMKRHYTRFVFQIIFLFLSIYAFLIFAVPVYLHEIGNTVFIFSGVLSLFLISLFISFISRFSNKKHAASRRSVYASVFLIFFSVNVLYFLNLIPPIPLSLKDGGIYYSVKKNDSGDYVVVQEDKGILEYFRLYKNIKKIPNTSIYAYSAVFSPTGLNLSIFHEWQRYDTNKNEWLSERTIELPVTGGRDGGFRTFSVRQNLLPGKWRVNILTAEGRLVGRLRFNLINDSNAPILETKVK